MPCKWKNLEYVYPGQTVVMNIVQVLLILSRTFLGIFKDCMIDNELFPNLSTYFVLKD